MRLIKEIYQSAKAAVRVGDDFGEWFKQETGVRQGDPLSPTIFSIYLERVMHDIQLRMGGIAIHGRNINNLRYADDIDLMETDERRLQENVNNINTEGTRAGLKINIRKSKVMVMGTDEIDINIMVNGQDLKAWKNLNILEAR